MYAMHIYKGNTAQGSLAVPPNVKAICAGGKSKQCGKQVSGNDVGIECDKCSGWLYASCQDTASGAVQAIGKYNMLWLCHNCKKAVLKFDPQTDSLPGLNLALKITELESAIKEQSKTITALLASQKEVVETIHAGNKELGNAMKDQSKAVTQSANKFEEKQVSYASVHTARLLW